MKRTLMIAALLVATNSAYGADSLVESVETIPLKDGGTLYIFSDGKMSMADRVGQVYRMKPGQPMETVDGKTIIMIGDEVQRLHLNLYDQYGSG